jgi:hypothetical protein
VTTDEWERIVLRLNASWPGQQLEPATAVEWYGELFEYPAERVWEAVRRCRREQSFRPSLAELLDAMLANSRDRAARPSDRPAIQARNPNQGGGPPLASFRLAMRNLLRRLPPDAAEPPPGRSRDQQLAELEEMAKREASQ